MKHCVAIQSKYPRTVVVSLGREHRWSANPEATVSPGVFANLTVLKFSSQFTLAHIGCGGGRGQGSNIYKLGSHPRPGVPDVASGGISVDNKRVSTPEPGPIVRHSQDDCVGLALWLRYDQIQGQ
ncbi:hypothetical protein RRG08_034393 [Elysia crispata]|uniref:Uncharacterized protein n=1 Tax=Elysia crispata TaxID=231223 RepID=A0AAE1CWF3_9GAST|nr:hypothetical protein RRG08_034393 [Elysia crispata]